MFWNKKKPVAVEPIYIKNDKGNLVGVQIGDKQFRLASYDLMANSPGQKSMYMFDQLGNKVVWDIKSFEELDTFLKTSFKQ